MIISNARRQDNKLFSINNSTVAPIPPRSFPRGLTRGMYNIYVYIRRVRLFLVWFTIGRENIAKIKIKRRPSRPRRFARYRRRWNRHVRVIEYEYLARNNIIIARAVRRRHELEYFTNIRLVLYTFRSRDHVLRVLSFPPGGTRQIHAVYVHYVQRMHIYIYIPYTVSRHRKCFDFIRFRVMWYCECFSE